MAVGSETERSSPSLHVVLGQLGNGAGPEISEPISPELILIDPELRERARRALPPPGALPITAPRTPNKTAESARALTLELPEEPPRPLAAVRALVFTTGLVVLATVALLAVAEVAREGPSLTSQPPERPSNGATALPRSRTGPARTPVGPPTTRPVAPPQPKPAKRARQRTATAQQRAPTSRPERGIAISWSRVRRATSYWVQVYRVGLPGARKVLEATVREPRLTLRRGRTLRPGRYRWEVWPQFGSPRTHEYTRLAAKGVFVIGRH
jgi:hypothetical protein